MEKTKKNLELTIKTSKELQRLKIPTPQELDLYEEVSPGIAKQIIKLCSQKLTTQSTNFTTLKSAFEFLFRFIRSSIIFYFIVRDFFD